MGRDQGTGFQESNFSMHRLEFRVLVNDVQTPNKETYVGGCYSLWLDVSKGI